jgi:hypothetical protein
MQRGVRAFQAECAASASAEGMPTSASSPRLSSRMSMRDADSLARVSGAQLIVSTDAAGSPTFSICGFYLCHSWLTVCAVNAWRFVRSRL